MTLCNVLAREQGVVCMAGIVGNKWTMDDFTPFESIPTSVCLTTYSGSQDDFMATPLQKLVEQVAAAGTCANRKDVQIG